jgi:hypothetical protein
MEMDPGVVVERILAASQALDQLTLAALRMTDSRCWDDMQGRPRLNAYGASVLAKKIGLRIKLHGAREIESGKDANGPFFVYQCTGEISHPLSPAIIPCQGTCDSRNKFHTTRYEDVKDEHGKTIWEEYSYFDKYKGKRVTKRRPKRKRIQLAAHQVQRAFIAQQAHTLAKTKGVAEFLGLDRFTWEEVEEHSHARRRDAATVLFEDKGKDQEARQKAEKRRRAAKAAEVPEAPEEREKPTEAGSEPATGKERNLVWQGYLDMRGWDPGELPKDAAEQFYSWVEKTAGEEYRDKSKWTRKAVDTMLKSIDDALGF